MPGKVNSFIKKVKSTIENFMMLDKGEQVLAGISGGQDSMALLYSLYILRKDLSIEITVFHLNHQFRGIEAERDANFVRDKAHVLGLPVIIETFNVPEFLTKSRHSPEEGARVIRYKLMEDSAKRLGIPKIALGHTADDNAETIIMRLLNGTSLTGLSGIPPKREKIIRPLIEIERKEIETFIEDQGIDYIVDSSNKESVHLRNRLRHHLFPILKEMNPNLISRISEVVDLLRHDEDFLKSLTDAYFEEVVKNRNNGKITFNGEKLLSLPYPIGSRILKNAIYQLKSEGVRITSAHIKLIFDILKSSSPNKKISLPQDIIVLKGYNTIEIIVGQREEKAFCRKFWNLPYKVQLEEAGFEVTFEKMRRMDVNHFPDNRNTALLDYCKLQYPVTIRSFKNGDRFVPLGMKGSKKVKDLFIDHKVPRELRKRVPLLLFDDRIAWVMGYRIDERFKVDSSTCDVVKVAIRLCCDSR